MTPAIAVEGLTAGYGHRKVVHEIDFDLAPGATAALIGPNGAGKTTLLRCLAGQMTPLCGRVCLDGTPLTRLSDRERARRLGIVPQYFEVPAAFSVEGIVAMGRTAHHPRWRGGGAADAAAIERALALTDTLDLRHRDLATLSGGERQRVILAMFLAQEPSVLLLDEATAHLDLNHRREVMQIIERLNRETGLTLLLVTHDLDLAAACCERLLLMQDGRLVADGPPSEVLSPTRIAEVYGCEVRVERGSVSGQLHVVPAPRETLSRIGEGLSVHVVAGGGSAETLLRRLALSGYAVSVGVINRRDSDADAARALGLTTALEAPFHPIGDAAYATAEAQVRQAGSLVVAPVPFGSGNLRNLELAALALRMGKTVLLADGVDSRDFTANRQATARCRQLLADGAQAFHGAADLLSRLPAREPDRPALRGAFPFRLGAPSYILPADIRPNARALAGRIDDLTLLLFETPEVSSLPDAETVTALTTLRATQALSYSVHLPLDLDLGAADPATRRRSLETAGRIVDALRSLSPSAWILHLNPDPGVPPAQAPSNRVADWQQRQIDGLRAFLETTGIPPTLVAVETLAYPFAAVDPILDALSLSVCLDVGHLLLRGDDPLAMLQRYGARTRVMHLHGIRDGRDHVDLTQLPENLVTELVLRFSALCAKAPVCADAAHARILTLEVFNEHDLNRSIELLQRLTQTAKGPAPPA